MSQHRVKHSPAAGAALCAQVLLSCLVAGGAGSQQPPACPALRSHHAAPERIAERSPSLRSHAESAGLLRGGRIEGARVTIFKKPRLLVVSARGIALATYRIELGPDPDEPKERLGDGRTPEGEYYICEHRGASRYHRGLLLSYPNQADAARGFVDGLIDERESSAIRRANAVRACPPQHTALGGLILIHGQHPEETAVWEALRRDARLPLPAGLESGDRSPDLAVPFPDWTAGCVGVRNQDIRELYDLLPTGTPVSIRHDE